MAGGFALLTIRWRSAVLIAIAALFAVAALVAPRALRGIYRLWMRIGEALAWINTRIILSVIFYGIVTPMGIVMRRFGRERDIGAMGLVAAAKGEKRRVGVPGRRYQFDISGSRLLRRGADSQSAASTLLSTLFACPTLARHGCGYPEMAS